ncbi:MAG TPA: DUF4845 domain-containing protein [Burkholderiales bacterium]|nr:DUF4845 domain-containing protein [Burkholderiales bacterium]
MHRERGLGAIGLVLLLAMGGFVAIVGIKLFPIYMEYFAIKRALVATAQSAETRSGSVAELRRAIDRRFMVDDIKVITAADVDVAKSAGGAELSVSYSAKVPLFANASACLDFEVTSAP